MDHLSAGAPSLRSVGVLVLGAIVLLPLAAACRPTPAPLPPTPTVSPSPTPKTGPATLRIDVRPHGASVRVDGGVQGRSPLTLTLEAGAHALLIEHEGFAPLQEALELEPGGEAMIAGALVDTEPPHVSMSRAPQQPVAGQVVSITVVASDNVALGHLEVLVDGQLLEQATVADTQEQTAKADWTADTAGEHEVSIRAKDAEGNTSELVQTITVGIAPAPSPTRAPTPKATPPSPTVEATPSALSAGPTITATVSVDVLNLRSGPAMQFDRVGTLARGEQLIVQGRNGDGTWLLVGAGGGQQAWVSSDLLAVSLPLEDVPLAMDIPTPPAPTPMGSSAPPVSVIETTVTIPTYPYEAFVRREVDPAHGNVPLLVLDRAAYEAANPLPEPRQYRLIVLENEFLRLTILPELGGRIYECIFKPTTHNQFYRNPVIKPTHWGPSEPEGADWWLAIGGVEWALPVPEHGYEWALPWTARVTQRSDGGATVTLTDGEGQRLKTTVEVTLRPGRAAWEVAVTLENATSGALPYQFWSNAMLAPGGENSPSEGLQFIFPASEMTVHSSGDMRMGSEGAAFSWPVFGGRDLSMLNTWREYLGFFVRPQAQVGFVGAYDHTADEGIVRVFPPEVARGAKGFAFGWAEAAIGPDNWTDDASGYVELHGGVTPTFSDWAELAAGQSLSWKETWYPVAGLGGVLYASEAGAVNLDAGGDGLHVRLFTASRLKASLRITAGDAVVLDKDIQVGPDDVFEETMPLAAGVTQEGPFAVTLTGTEDGAVYMAMPPRSLVPR